MKKLLLTTFFIILYISATSLTLPKTKEDSSELNYFNKYKRVKEYLKEIDSPISPELFYFTCYIYNIEVEFALSVGWLESNLGTSKTGRHIRNKSAFSVGEYSNKSLYKNKTYDVGTIRFCKLIRSKYLVNNKNIQDLLKNFINYRGNRYASSLIYEKKLNKIYKQIKLKLNGNSNW